MDLEAQIAAINAKYAPLLVNAGNESGAAKVQVKAQKDAEILAAKNAAAAASSATTDDTTEGGDEFVTLPLLEKSWLTFSMSSTNASESSSVSRMSVPSD